MTSVDDVWTIAPLAGRDAIDVRDIMRGVLSEAGLDYIAGISTLSARSFVHVTMIIFDMPGKQGSWPKRLREEHP